MHDPHPATVVDLAGADIPDHMQGRSLARADFDPDTELAFGMRNRMDERIDMVRTVRDARHRYIRNYFPHRPYGQHQGFPWMAAGPGSGRPSGWPGASTTRSRPSGVLSPASSCTTRSPTPIRSATWPAIRRMPHVEQRLADALRGHMLAVNDSGFLPEGAAAEGFDESREPDAYPLDRVLDLADLVGPRYDPAARERFAVALDDPDATMPPAAVDRAARLRGAG
ncbi:hypothetical protein ACU686_10210 [Yinghuangia aomiensis]